MSGQLATVRNNPRETVSDRRLKDFLYLASSMSLSGPGMNKTYDSGKLRFPSLYFSSSRREMPSFRLVKEAISPPSGPMAVHLAWIGVFQQRQRAFRVSMKNNMRLVRIPFGTH